LKFLYAHNTASDLVYCKTTASGVHPLLLSLLGTLFIFLEMPNSLSQIHLPSHSQNLQMRIRRVSTVDSQYVLFV
jgi:hypothetical protein